MNERKEVITNSYEDKANITGWKAVIQEGVSGLIHTREVASIKEIYKRIVKCIVV